MDNIQQKLREAYKLLVDADKKDYEDLLFAAEEALGYIAEAYDDLEGL